MAAEFTQVSLEDMKKYLRRAFGSLPSKQSVQRGETVFDLSITDNVGIRIYTSVGHDKDQAAGRGEDAIRVLMWNIAKNRPMKSGKAVAVKRTQGWKDTLRRKIEDVLEEYYEKEESWEASTQREDRAPGSGPSPAQIQYAERLLKQNRHPEMNLSALSSREISQLIDALKSGKPIPSGIGGGKMKHDYDGESEVFDWESGHN